MTTQTKTAPITIFDSDMKCLVCGQQVVRQEYGYGFLCTNEDCGCFYWYNGTLDMDSIPEGYQPDGSIPMVVDSNHGCCWFWCDYHEDYERESAFDNPPCVRLIHDMTLRLSG